MGRTHSQSSQPYLLVPSPTRRPNVAFRAARHRRYKILLLRPVWGVVPLGSSFLSLSPDDRNAHCVEQSWSYFWRPPLGIDQSEQAQGRATPASYRNIEDDNLKLSQLQNVLLLFLAFPSLSNIAALTPAAKQHQFIVLIGRLGGWSHFNDLSSRLETLPYMEQRPLNSRVCC